MVHDLIKARIPPGSSGTVYPCLENRVNAQRPKGPRKPWLEMPSEIVRNRPKLGFLGFLANEEVPLASSVPWAADFG